MYSGIVREIVRDGLVAVKQIAGAKRSVHDFHGGQMAALGWQIGFVERQGFLEVGNIFLIDLELLALFFVANQHGGAVRGFYAEQIVEIGFVGSENEDRIWDSLSPARRDRSDNNHR